MTQYAKRRIDVTINAGKGQFGDDKGDDVTLTGLRVAANVSYAGGHAQAQAQVRIYGLPLTMINQLTGLGPFASLEMRRNTILGAAGDVDGRMSTVYQGSIIQAHGDFDGAPEVAFDIIALAAAVDAVKPVGARSYIGAVDAAVMMKDLADTMGLAFENSRNLSVMLTNQYLPGCALQQVKDVAEAAGIGYSVEYGKLAIWPKNSYRELGESIEISPDTGMVGYPSFASQGISVTTLFNPDLVLQRKVRIKSSLTPANGEWVVYSVAHSIESETPNGQWFTHVNCMRTMA
jgi:hypothetical protein